MADARLNVHSETKGSEKDLEKLEKRLEKLEKRLRKVGKTSKQSAPNLGHFRDNLSGIVAPIGVAVTALIGLERALTSISQKSLNFEKVITPLIGLGENVKNIQGIKKEITNLATATGISQEEIARSMFTLQSSTGSLSETMRKDLLQQAILVKKVMGVDLNEAVGSLTTLWNIYGKELNNTTQLTTVMKMVNDDAKISFSTLARFMPEVASAGQAMGKTFEGIAGAVSIATQTSGDAGKAMTAVRNIILRMDKSAAKLGITTKGTFADFLKSVKKVLDLQPEKITEAFEVSDIPIVKQLAKNVDKVADATKRYKNLQGLSLEETLKLRKENDEIFRVSELINEEQKKQAKNFKTLTDLATPLRKEVEKTKTAATDYLTEIVKGAKTLKDILDELEKRRKKDAEKEKKRTEVKRKSLTRQIFGDKLIDTIIEMFGFEEIPKKGVPERKKIPRRSLLRQLIGDELLLAGTPGARRAEEGLVKKDILRRHFLPTEAESVRKIAESIPSDISIPGADIKLPRIEAMRRIEQAREERTLAFSREMSIRITEAVSNNTFQVMNKQINQKKKAQ